MFAAGATGEKTCGQDDGGDPLGDHRGDGRSADAPGGEAELAEDQEIVEKGVDDKTGTLGDRGGDGVPAADEKTGDRLKSRRGAELVCDARV